MSLEICRHENARHPEHLRTNINATCYAYLSHVIDLLRAAGHEAYFICKTAGEGQYTPPGFVPFTGPGLDGKPYTYTGVSHDALWCDGRQFDTAARANDSPDPIVNPDGSPMTAEPVWNAIPPQYWRPQNPPLKDQVSPPEPSPFPTYEEAGGDSFYRAVVGVPLAADYAMAGQALNDGSAVWFSRTIYDVLAALVKANGQPIDPTSIVKKHRNEWRRVLGLSPLP